MLSLTKEIKEAFNSFNSYKGTIVILKMIKKENENLSFNSYKGTIVIILVEFFGNLELCFNSYKGTIVMMKFIHFHYEA